MTDRVNPAEIVQRQLDAYNAKNMEAWLATYAPDAEQFTLHGGLIAKGHAALRERMRVRFAEPQLHATLLQRTVMANVVIDHERIRRNFAEGSGTVEMLCIYEVAGDVIQKASFVLAAPVIDKPLHP